MFGLPSREKLALLAFAPRMQALERLREGVGGLRPEEVIDLARAAGLGEAAAQRLGTLRMRAMVKAGEGS